RRRARAAEVLVPLYGGRAARRERLARGGDRCARVRSIGVLREDLMTASSPGTHPTGDDARLAARLEPLTRWRNVTHLAAALVEDGGSRVTFAGRDADEGSDFEIGSITKGLTGLLLADSVERGEVQL